MSQSYRLKSNLRTKLCQSFVKTKIINKLTKITNTFHHLGGMISSLGLSIVHAIHNIIKGRLSWKK